MTTGDTAKDLGRSLAQLHVKLGGIQGAIDRVASARAPSGDGKNEGLDLLLDLLDGVDRALEQRTRVGQDEARRGWWPLGRRGPGGRGDGGRGDGPVWEGLAVASAAALEGLQRLGIRPIAAEGPPDGRFHRIAECRGEGGGDVRIERTLRRGWIRGDSVLRTAEVIVRSGR